MGYPEENADDAENLRRQSRECFAKASALFDGADVEPLNQILANIRKGDPKALRDHGMDGDVLGLPDQPTFKDFLHTCFQTTIELVDDRLQNEGEVRKAPSHKVNIGRVLMGELLKRSPDEWHERLTEALKEFDAAAVIARSYEPGIRRGRALRRLEGRLQLSELKEFRMQMQMVDCLVAAQKPIRGPVSEEQDLKNLLRALRQRSVESGYNELAAQLAKDMDEGGIPLEATSKERTGINSLTEKIVECFRTISAMFHERWEGTLEELASAEQRVKAARIELEGLINKPLYRELKEPLQKALFEFDTAVIIAKSGDPEIKRKDARRMLKEQRGNEGRQH